MKKLKYSISFFAAALVLAGAYYTSYQISYQNSQERARESRESGEQKTPVQTVEKTPQNVVTNKTRYVLEIYDEKDHSTRRTESGVPAAYIGFTRADLTNYLARYETNPELSDIEQGFLSFRLVSFSPDKIVLRKTINTAKKDDMYCLIAEDGYVTVYYMDKKTVYTYTGIKLNTLPEELCEDILDGGRTLHNSEELYGFLENYSS